MQDMKMQNMKMQNMACVPIEKKLGKFTKLIIQAQTSILPSNE